MNARTRPREQRQGNEGGRHPVDRLGHGHGQHDGHGHGRNCHGHGQHHGHGHHDGAQFISSTLLRSCAELDLHATERPGLGLKVTKCAGLGRFTCLPGMGSA
jgi:hypothetical protein